MADVLDKIEVSSRTVSCDGGGVLGHPVIYLEIAPTKETVTCPYCSRVFSFKKA